jgi:hypothetical protein
VGQQAGQGTANAGAQAAPAQAPAAGTAVPADDAVTLSGAIAELADGEPMPATFDADAKGRPLVVTADGTFLVTARSGAPLPPAGTAVLLRLLQSDGRTRALAETVGGDGDQIDLLLHAIADEPPTPGAHAPRLSNLPLPEGLKSLVLAAERLIAGTGAAPAPSTERVRAEIVGADADGRVELRIGAERFALGPLAAPPAGRAIDLRILAAHGTLRAVVLAPDGRPSGPPLPLVPLRGSETVARTAGPGRVAHAIVIADPEGRPQTLAAGTVVSVRFGPTAGADARHVQALVVRGDIDGAAPRGIVVRTPVGLLQIEGIAPLPAGTPLNLEISALDGARPPGPPPTTSTSDLPPLARRLAPFLDGWPALDETMAAIAAADPEVAARSAELAVAAPGPRMPSAFALFLAALRFGDVAGWLGPDAVSALRAGGRSTLLKRLGDDLKALADVAASPDAEGWHATLVPLGVGGPIQPLVLYTRRNSGQDADNGGGSTRFMLEVSLSTLGPLQLDGMVAGLRCDLMVRTIHPLDDEIRAGLAARYGETLALTGRVGHVGFQTLPSLPPLPPERPGAGGNGALAGSIRALSV